MPYFAVIYRHHVDICRISLSPGHEHELYLHIQPRRALGSEPDRTSWVSTLQPCRIRLQPVP